MSFGTLSQGGQGYWDCAPIHLPITAILLGISCALTLEDGSHYCPNLHVSLRRVGASYWQSRASGSVQERDSSDSLPSWSS
jgi:hypothetical protein